MGTLTAPHGVFSAKLVTSLFVFLLSPPLYGAYVSLVVIEHVANPLRIMRQNQGSVGRY